MKFTLDSGAFAPTRAHKTDAGLDLRSPICIEVPANGSSVIDTGVHVELPNGTVGFLKSKSGLNVNVMPIILLNLIYLWAVVSRPLY